MNCMNPVSIYWNSYEQKYVYTKPDNISSEDLEKSIVVKCGRCPACRQEWRTQLARRTNYELKDYHPSEVCFLTLTCDEKHMDEVFPGRSLSHEYFKKFMKKLREYLIYWKIPHKPLKYLVCGEYGAHNTHRPHFHVILFGWSPTDLVQKLGKTKSGFNRFESKIIQDRWKVGWTEVGVVTERTAPYMVKYIVKHSEDRKVETYDGYGLEEGVDCKTGEVFYYLASKKKRRYVFENPTPLTDKKGNFLKDENDNYICEIRKVRAPYIVYPKKILGIDYFLAHFKQILRNGYILDSLGNRHSIPRSFLKYCEKQDENSEIHRLYLEYKDRLQLLFEQEKEYLISLGYVTYWDRLRYYREQGEILRKKYESYKNKNR